MFPYQQENEEHNFWISYADLVTGFMIIFIVITMILFTNQEKEIPPPPEPEPPIVERVDTIPTPVDEKGTIGVLKEQLEEILEKNSDLKKNIKITDDATIRFFSSKKSSLFATGDTLLRRDFKRNISKLLPDYFKILKQFINDSNQGFTIKEIRIEGHTNSDGSYEGNLKLSAKRAVETQYYIRKTSAYKELPKKFKNLLEKKTIVIGFADSKIIDKSGKYIAKKLKNKEDKRKSKRVEFRVLIEKKEKDNEN